MSINKKQFVFNAASGWIAQLVFALVGFILMPYCLDRLGEQSFGIYQLARSVIVFFMFLQLGMGPTLVRFCSQAVAQNDQNKIRKISSTAQLLLGGLGLIASLLCLLLIPFFIRFYEIPPVLARETTALLICMAISMFLNMTVIVPQGLVFSSNRYDLANGIGIISNILRLVFMVVLFELLHPSIFYVGLAMLGMALFRFIALFYTGYKQLGDVIFFSFRFVNRETIHSILGFSMLNLANSVAATIVFQGPVLIIGKILGEESVAAFAPALMISSALQGFLGQTAKPLVPIASRDISKNSGTSLGIWAIYMGRFVAFIGFGIVLPLTIFGPEIVALWIGENLSWTWSIIAVITTGVAISQIQAANYCLALGGGSIKPSVYSQIVMAIIIMTGTLIGTMYGGWDLFAIALFLAICFVIRNTFYLSYAFSHQFLYDYWYYLWAVYCLPALIAAGCVCMGWGLKTWLPPNEFILLSIEIILIMCSYCVLSWFFLISHPMKIKILALIFYKIKHTSMAISLTLRGTK